MNKLGPRIQTQEKTLTASPLLRAGTSAASSSSAHRATVAQTHRSNKFDSLIVTVPRQFVPGMTPKLFDADGKLLYGTSSLQFERYALQGVSAWISDSVDTAKDKLAAHGGKTPLLVQGFLHPGNRDVDLSDQDARQVASEVPLQKGLVYIVRTSTR